MVAAARLAFRQINNKTDGVFDTLLPHYEVHLEVYLWIKSVNHNVNQPQTLFHIVVYSCHVCPNSWRWYQRIPR